MRSLKDINDDLDVSSNFALLSFQPSSFEEAIRDENRVQAMDEEIKAIEKNDTWDLVDLPKDKNLIGFSQQSGIDFGETFAPVARLDTVREFLATAAHNKCKVYQMDVKSAFLNGILEEEIYVQQPLGYEVESNEEKVYNLKKALYGLKQAPRAWY
eukprot:PITA_19551